MEDGLELFLSILVVLHCLNVLLAIAGIFKTSLVIDRNLEYVRIHGGDERKAVRGQAVAMATMKEERKEYEKIKDGDEDSFSDYEDGVKLDDVSDNSEL